MVGVAGRSKACTTCKARHVRCDAHHPICHRCENGGFECQGYNRPLLFVNFTVQSTKHNLSQQREGSKRSSSRSQDKQNERMKYRADNSTIGNTSLSRPTHDNPCSFDTSPLELSFQSCLRIWPSNDAVFTSSYLHVTTATTAADSSISNRILGSSTVGSRVWTQLHGHAANQVQTFLHNLLIAQGMGLGVLRSHQQDRGSLQPLALELTVEAAALALYGRLTKHAPNLQQAIMIYQLALRQLRTQLSHADGNLISSTAVNVSLLTIIMNMTLFEWITSSTGGAWKEHVRGLAAWVEKCGPEAFRQEDMRLALERARAHIMLLHMDEAQRTFLEEPCWQTIPWSDHPNQKSFANRYIDIVCCIPGILEDKKRRHKIRQDHIKNGTTWSCNLRQSLRQRVILLYFKLLHLRWEWELQHPSCCFEVSEESRIDGRGALSVNEATGQPIFDSVLFFTDFRRAVEINFYHTCLLILHDVAGGLGIIDELNDHQTSPSFFSYKTNSPLTFPHDIEPDQSAVRDICRSAEFLLQPAHGPAGVYVLMFPLRVAQIYHDIRLPSRDYSKGKVNDINAETSVLNVHMREPDVYIAKSHSSVDVGQCDMDDSRFPSVVEHIDSPASPQIYRSQRKRTIVEAENNTAVKFGQHAVISEWIQRVMHYIDSVQGFSVSTSYAS